MLDVSGDVAPGFGPVADAFRENFQSHSDIGAACAVVVDGAKVVDLFAGRSRPDTVWTTATRSVVFP